MVGLQVLLIGMLADGVIRRIALHNEPLVTSYAVTSLELGDGKQVEQAPVHSAENQ